jgi:hypothetical protein
VLLVLLTLLFDGMRLISSAVGVVYPAFRSFQAIESSAKSDDTQWLIYWVTFAAFSFLENFTDILLFWFPFYFTFKVPVPVLPMLASGSGTLGLRPCRGGRSWPCSCGSWRLSISTAPTLCTTTCSSASC